MLREWYSASDYKCKYCGESVGCPSTARSDKKFCSPRCGRKFRQDMNNMVGDLTVMKDKLTKEGK